jgi:hypothetical protein
MSPKSDVGEWLSHQYRKDPGLKQRVDALVEECTWWRRSWPCARPAASPSASSPRASG